MRTPDTARRRCAGLVPMSACPVPDCPQPFAHRHCASCGGYISGDDTVFCAHHATAHEEGWAVANTVWCHLIHRGIEPARLPASEREDPPAIGGDGS